MIKKLVFACFVFLLVAAPVSAAEVKSGEEFYLTESENIEGNLYTAAGYVDIAGNVSGDVLTAGGSVIVTGEIGEDLMVVGGDVDLWGTVGGDLRVAGGNVLVGGDVGGDILAVGGMVMIRPNVTVGGDVIVAGGAVVVGGSIGGDVRAAAGDLMVGGSIGGDVKVIYDESFKVIDATSIGGNLKYTGNKEIEIPEGAAIDGGVNYQAPKAREAVKAVAPKQAEKPTATIVIGIILWLMIKAIIISVVALAGVLAYRKRSQEMVDHAVKHFGWELLRGFLVFIFSPVVIMVLILSMVGSLLGAAVGLIYGLIYITAMAYSGVLLGAMIFKLLGRKKTYSVTWQSAVVGVFLIHLVKLIPILGWLFCAVFMLVALGTICDMTYHYYWVKRSK